MCAGTMFGMTDETIANNGSSQDSNFSASAAEQAKRKALRKYMTLATKASQEVLSDEELTVFNSTLGDNGIGGLDTLLGTKFVHVGPERIQMELEVGPDHLQPWGLANGGVYCSLGETAGSIAGFVACGAKKPVVGVNNNTDFYRSARAGEVIVTTAEPEYLGRTMQLWRIEHTRKADEKLLARTNLRIAVLDKPL